MMRCSAKTNADRVCKNKVSRMRGEVYCPVHRASHETPEQTRKRELLLQTAQRGRENAMETIWRTFWERAPAFPDPDEVAGAEALVNLATVGEYDDLLFEARLVMTAVPKNDVERDWFGVSHWNIPADHVLYYDNLSLIRNTFIERWTDNCGEFQCNFACTSKFDSDYGQPVRLRLEGYGIPEGFRFPDYSWTDGDDNYRVHYTIKFERVE